MCPAAGADCRARGRRTEAPCSRSIHARLPCLCTASLPQAHPQVRVPGRRMRRPSLPAAASAGAHGLERHAARHHAAPFTTGLGCSLPPLPVPVPNLSSLHGTAAARRPRAELGLLISAEAGSTHGCDHPCSALLQEQPRAAWAAHDASLRHTSSMPARAAASRISLRLSSQERLK
jgi:hypothetical protein